MEQAPNKRINNGGWDPGAMGTQRNSLHWQSSVDDGKRRVKGKNKLR